MQDPIKTNYRGFDLIYQTHEDNWAIGGDKGDKKRTFEKLSEAKIYIDELLKGEFKRFTVIHKDMFSSELQVMTVTSKPDENNLWLVTQEGTKLKSHIRNCYVHNESNSITMQQISDINFEIENLSKQREKHLKNMLTLFSQNGKEKIL